MFRSKPDSDLKEAVINIPGLSTFIPKNFSGFSKKHKYIFWDSFIEEVKRKLEYLEQHKDSSPLDFLLKREIGKLSRDNQVVNYTVNIVARPSSKVLSTMANRYAPLALPANLNAMPANYGTKIKQFWADEAYTAKQHV